MDIIELIIDENEELSGIEAVSVVENPAIEEFFVALKKEDELIRLAEVDEEKRLLMGAALIPNKPIYRANANGEFYIYFSKETVVKASQMFLRKGNQNNSTLEHQKDFLKDMSVVESWIVEDPEVDKSKLYGLNMPVGTWIITMSVQNDKIWEKVRKNLVRGFSIEGYFADKLQRPQDKQKDQLTEEQQLINQIKNVI
jgi:hypothetical protein|tara:strand:- start:843 stop:1436 length:594 start_codon:yes stop_codon:yes gene_type:complete